MTRWTTLIEHDTEHSIGVSDGVGIHCGATASLVKLIW